MPAVLTGDIILSEKISRAIRKGLPDQLSVASSDLRGVGVAISDVDVFRGDAWQVIVDDPARAMDAALYIRCCLKSWMPGVDTRVSTGIGRIDSRGDGRISSGFGEAFTLSGRGLDQLTHDRRMALRLASVSVDVADLLDASVSLLDRHATSWTLAQARAVRGALLGRSQEEIAAQWPGAPISQQAVGQHLKRAKWSAIDGWLRAFRAYIASHED